MIYYFNLQKQKTTRKEFTVENLKKDLFETEEEAVGVGSLFFTEKGVWYKDKRIDDPVLQVFLFGLMMLVMILAGFFMVVLFPIHWLLLKYRGKGLWLAKKTKILGLIHNNVNTQDND